ncbi:MAG TPA: alpha/beta fold hydrolase [Ktedonobacteraceae bacterium]|nr:alpha/beta fold hydrolase [Ktedonobacteraceae bacterium]
MRRITNYIWVGLKLLLLCVCGVLFVTLRYILKTPQPIDSGLSGEARFYRWKHGHVFYNVMGDAEAAPVVLWHAPGIGASSYEMRYLQEQLARQYRVYTPDLPGFGNSDHLSVPYSADLYVALMRDFLTEVVGKPATLLASGLSANYCVKAAAHEPIFCRRIILLSPLALHESGKRITWIEAIARNRWLGFSLYALLTARPLLRRIVSMRYNDSSAAALPGELDHAYAAAHQLGAHKAALALLAGALDLPMMQHQLAHVPQPVLLIWGAKTPPTRPQLSAGASVQKVVVIQEAGRRPHEEQPARVVANVVAVLEQDQQPMPEAEPEQDQQPMPEAEPEPEHTEEAAYDLLEKGVVHESTPDDQARATLAVPVELEPEPEPAQQSAVQQERVVAYCVKCKQKRDMQNPRKITTKNGRRAMEGTCSICGTRLFRFIAG